MKRGILWTFIAAFFLIGGYFVYQKWWGLPEGGSVLGKMKEIALERISTAGEFIKGKTGKTIEEASINSYSYVKKGAGSALAFLGSGIESLGEGLTGEASTSSSAFPSPLPTSPSYAGDESGFFLPPPLFAVSGKPGETLLFSLNRAGTYFISWGDGEKEVFSVGTEEAKVAGHSWARRGDFEIIMTFTSGTIREELRVFARIMES